MKQYVKLMRVHHYIKNILIFAPLIFHGSVLEGHLLLQASLGFVVFSLLASTIYIYNDIGDIEVDRLHPTKRNRPLANGTVSKKQGIILALVLFSIACLLNFYLSINQYEIWIIFILYFVLNLSYSYGLKHIPIIDVAIVALGFVLRLLYGAAITDIAISNWLYLTVIAMSFYLALGKRRNELIQHQDSTRQVLKTYTQSFLDKNMYVSLGLTITFYALWTVDPITITRINSDYLIWTVPLVVLICMRYSLNIEKESDGDPVEVFIHDKLLIGLVLIFASVVLTLIYT